MPKYVDHDQRKHDIVLATLDVLAESGTRGLSFRAIAARMGGSTTLVTHYFPTQEALLAEVATSSVAYWDQEIEQLDQMADTPQGRLENLLLWLIPITPEGLAQERARINLLSGQILGGDHRIAFESWDAKIREILKNHVNDLVPAGSVDETVELLRVATNGVVLSVIEHPARWSQERQVAVVEKLLGLLGLAPANGSLDPSVVADRPTAGSSKA